MHGSQDAAPLDLPFVLPPCLSLPSPPLYLFKARHRVGSRLPQESGCSRLFESSTLDRTPSNSRQTDLQFGQCLRPLGGRARILRIFGIGVFDRFLREIISLDNENCPKINARFELNIKENLQYLDIYLLRES